jgi:hypothetical protein
MRLMSEFAALLATLGAVVVALAIFAHRYERNGEWHSDDSLSGIFRPSEWLKLPQQRRLLPNGQWEYRDKPREEAERDNLDQQW